MRKCFLTGTDENERLHFWCPGCDNVMTVCPKRWHWNGDTEKPTLSPSIKQTCGPFPDGHTDVCHCFVREGVIEFCGDCTHKLLNTSMPLPEIDTVIALHIENDGRVWWHRKTAPITP